MRFLANLFLLVSVMATSWAQPMSPAQQGFADQMERQRIQNVQSMYEQEQQRRAQAEAQRQWQQREDAIQAQIAKWRATPYYGSLVVENGSTKIGWGGGGYVTKERAGQKALEQCKTGNCRILATVSNGCMVPARPASAIDGSEWLVANDIDPGKAIEKAIRLCEKKYGAGQCGVAENHNTKHRAYCSGYDYEAYNQN